VRDIGNLVRVDAENFKSAYEALKLYLMLIQPEHLNLDWAVPHLTQAWLSAMGGEGHSSRGKIEDHARRYLLALQSDASWAWPNDPNVIGRARGRLASQPLDELRYGWLVEKTKNVPAIKPSKIFFGASAQYFSARDNVEVRGLYTAAGWEIVRAALDSSEAEFDFEPWVLGQEVARLSDGSSGGKRLRELYFERYVRACRISWGRSRSLLRPTSRPRTTNCARSPRRTAHTSACSARSPTTRRSICRRCHSPTRRSPKAKS